jgi:type II secretion system protein G
MGSTAAPAERENDGERGFTLVELMVVVAIIALIATIIIPNFVHARQEAQLATSEANLKQIATAMELYYNDTDSYPAASNAIAPSTFTTGNNDGTKYLPTPPVDPVNGGPYQLQVSNVPGQPAYAIIAPGVYDPAALSKVATCPAGNANTNGTAGTQILYSPQLGICKA